MTRFAEITAEYLWARPRRRGSRPLLLSDANQRDFAFSGPTQLNVLKPVSMYTYHRNIYVTKLVSHNCCKQVQCKPVHDCSMKSLPIYSMLHIISSVVTLQTSEKLNEIWRHYIGLMSRAARE